MTTTTNARRRVLPAAVLSAVLLVAPTSAATAAPPAPPPLPAAAPADPAAVQAALDALTSSGAQGAQVRVTEDGRELLLRSGTADHGGVRPVPLDGRFRVGSITKPVVAAVVLQLVGEGRVELDAPVERYLPGLLPDGDRITVRMLLQHTSGLAEYTGLLPVRADGYDDREAYEEARWQRWEDRDLVALATARPLDFEPGTAWSYSNTGYVVAGMVVEAVTGAPWERAVQERVLAPLGLRDTAVPGTALLPPPHAHGYLRIEGQVVNATWLDPSVADAAGALVSTTADVDRFLAALLGGELLPPELLAEMVRPTATSPAYGLGIAVVPLPCGGALYGHDGGIDGYLSVAYSTPDTRERLVLSLTTAPDPGEFRGGQELLGEVFCG
ncbi:serine hydrolase domain-containing protein [Kineococcus sp. SYSU DK004]|uniref:serine hydrolase domain-containing protein n=1 Tax=Kineococcus sp. SYSU DK004 TaxID=3383125 RepID=UPI003D7DFBD8